MFTQKKPPLQVALQWGELAPKAFFQIYFGRIHFTEQISQQILWLNFLKFFTNPGA